MADIMIGDGVICKDGKVRRVVYPFEKSIQTWEKGLGTLYVDRKEMRHVAKQLWTTLPPPAKKR